MAVPALRLTTFRKLCSGAANLWTLPILQVPVYKAATLQKTRNERINVGGRRQPHGKSWWKSYKSGDLWYSAVMNGPLYHGRTTQELGRVSRDD